MKNEEELSSKVSKLSKLIALLNVNHSYAHGTHFVLKVDGTVASKQENRPVVISWRQLMNINNIMLKYFKIECSVQKRKIYGFKFTAKKKQQ